MRYFTLFLTILFNVITLQGTDELCQDDATVNVQPSALFMQQHKLALAQQQLLHTTTNQAQSKYLALAGGIFIGYLFNYLLYDQTLGPINTRNLNAQEAILAAGFCIGTPLLFIGTGLLNYLRDTQLETLAKLHLLLNSTHPASHIVHNITSHPLPDKTVQKTLEALCQEHFSSEEEADHITRKILKKLINSLLKGISKKRLLLHLFSGIFFGHSIKTIAETANYCKQYGYRCGFIAGKHNEKILTPEQQKLLCQANWQQFFASNGTKI